jgi:hypothetical protein
MIQMLPKTQPIDLMIHSGFHDKGPIHVEAFKSQLMLHVKYMGELIT